VKEATAISSAKLEAAWVGLTPVRVRSPLSIYLAGQNERWLLLFNTTRARAAHTLRTPKHESHYHYGRRCGRHNPC
jgi:hypothetical protein